LHYLGEHIRHKAESWEGAREIIMADNNRSVARKRRHAACALDLAGTASVHVWPFSAVWPEIYAQVIDDAEGRPWFPPLLLTRNCVTR